MQQYRNIHATRIYQTHTRVFKPYAVEAVAILDSAGVASDSWIKRGGWFDFASPVDTFNLRYFIDSTSLPSGVNAVYYDIDVVIGITCKNVR